MYVMYCRVLAHFDISQVILQSDAEKVSGVLTERRGRGREHFSTFVSSLQNHIQSSASCPLWGIISFL